MKTSASQLELINQCARKWWFRYRARLPEIKTEKSQASLSFGTVLHGCCERYLQDLDVFPEGWDVDKDTKKRIPPRDASLIRVLINKAIETGYLEKRPGQTVEKETLLDSSVGGVKIIVKKDFFTKERVEDHKTSSNPKYFLGPKKLANSIQMMIYAMDLIRKADERGELLSVVTLCHNQYLKDYEFPEVRRREVDVTREQIQKYWEETITPLVRLQVDLHKVDNPFDIPDPPPSRCQDYGGCSRLSICTGQETMEEYTRRVQTIAKNKENPMSDSEVKPVKPGDWLAKRASLSATASVNPPKPEPAAAPPPVTAAAETPPTRPPWAHPNCALCGTSKNPGFTSKGVVCRICVGMTGKSADGYRYETRPDGTIVWSRLDQPVATMAPPQVADAGTKKSYGLKDLMDVLNSVSSLEDITKTLEEAKALLGEGADLETLRSMAEKKMAAPPEEKVAATEEKPVAFEPPKEEPKRPPGRPRKNPPPAPAQVAQDTEAKPTPKKGFTLVIGAVVLRGGTMCFAEDFLLKLEGYYETSDVWHRRGVIREKAGTPEFREQLEGVILVQRGNDPDVENLITSLLPFASSVIQAVVR